MKRGAIKQVEKTFAAQLPADWLYSKGTFRRRFGDWLHNIGFNACRFDDTFEPVVSMGFLKDPVNVLGGFLGDGLKWDRYKVQRWVSLAEMERDAGAVYQDMLRQFRPRIDAPVDITEVKQMLRQRANYFPHVYAPCVMAAEIGDFDEARHWQQEVIKLIGDEYKAYDSSQKALDNVQKVIDLMESPEVLKDYLAGIVTAKLAEAKLTDLPDLAVPK